MYSVLFAILQKPQLLQNKDESERPNERQTSSSFKCYNCNNCISRKRETLDNILTMCCSTISCFLPHRSSNLSSLRSKTLNFDLTMTGNYLDIVSMFDDCSNITVPCCCLLHIVATVVIFYQCLCTLLSSSLQLFVLQNFFSQIYIIVILQFCCKLS